MGIITFCTPSFVKLRKAKETVIFHNSGETTKGFLSSVVLLTNESRPLAILFSSESLLK